MLPLFRLSPSPSAGISARTSLLWGGLGSGLFNEDRPAGRTRRWQAQSFSSFPDLLLNGEDVLEQRADIGRFLFRVVAPGQRRLGVEFASLIETPHLEAVAGLA